MNPGHHRLCLFSGPAFAVLFGVGLWVCAGYIPPHPPSADAGFIAALYQEHTVMIRLGQVLLMIGAGLQLVFNATLTTQLSRVESRPRVLSAVQLSCGIAAAMTVLLPSLFWTVASFRPERAPELTQMLNDLGWITMLMTFSPFSLQMTAAGLIILGDKSAVPLFPRWSAYFNFWVAILLLAGGLIPFFKTGPFAWDGLFGFWLPAIAFFLWIVVMTVVALKAVDRASGAATEAVP